ncbi:16S rRNA (cytidine(1402)-2'-O)-methyltransferase [Nakamurella multipartita]|uniref:Ribosomal RNA small subunit methyltransferase I n=1 Tax=Nakamurella multipartita (strain ATCC 700099 / DSM 44233 / CIP 104796 / JCM 9543 / NBRC 105858 / Y-104) TaxID=479431 RepID=C8X6U5_NAKMY|nr:Uroporphyrin-III C/tetrapyrrole (Corrin/Porphyrin) methyltransferase [Nakamurella multipartita DSM 44233]
MTGGVRPGGLVLAGTPLGRPEDASPRLRDALAGADVIAAEDTRRFRRLAADLDVAVSGSLVSYYEAVERARIPGLLERMQEGQTVVLVTDAGMPSVSDPGYRLVAATADAGLPITCVPGPSAVITALALSGLPSDRFCFEGFLPRKSGERARALADLATERRTMVFFESVHRIGDALAALGRAFGPDRPAALCRELTKTYEQVIRGTLADLVTAADGGLRGEITLVVGGAPVIAQAPPDEAELAGLVQDLVTAGRTRRDAVDEIAARLGLPRRAVYAAAVATR